MFTGIIQGVGTVRAIEPRGGDVTILIDTGRVPLSRRGTWGQYCRQRCLPDRHAGSSRTAFAADVSRETLSLTTLGSCGRPAVA
jgi:riboflavin synthase